MTSMHSHQPAQPDVFRGTLSALLVLPVGIIVWSALWHIGFVASFVALGVAWLASLLYRRGSGAPLDRQGAMRVAVITIATILASILCAVLWDFALFWATQTSMPPFSAFINADYWDLLGYNLSDDEVLGSIVPGVLIGLAFGALGCFSTLRGEFREAAATEPESSDPFAARNVPPASGAPYGYGAQEHGQPAAPPGAAPASDTRPGPRGPYGAMMADERESDPRA